MKKLALMVAIALLALATMAVAGDVTGEWKSKMETPRGSMERTFVLKQEGAKLTGKIVTQRGENKFETDIKEGKVAGDEIEFKAEQRRGQSGESVTVTYKATVSGDTMKGSFMMGERNVEWTATRAK